MSLRRAAVAACAAFAAGLSAPPSAMADDCVGWLRVHVPTGGVAAAAMPFEPMGDGGISSLLSGRFAEDVDLGLRDELAVVSGASGTLSRAVWSSGSWREPGGGAPAVAARPSDSLVLRLLPSDPFDVFIFGRVPLSDALASSLPPGLGLVSAGYPSHSFPTSSLPRGVSVDAAWAADCAGGVLPWRTPVLVTNANTSTVVWNRSRPYPVVPQGLPQALAMSVDAGFRFAESFERPSVVPGPLDGQNGWTATDGASAVVLANRAADGVAALELRPPAASEAAAEAMHSLSGAPQVVWLDVRVSGWSGLHERAPETPCAAAFGFDCEGHPVMFVAGGAAVTNTSASVDDDAWTRCTAMLDYGRRVWDFYVDGVLVGRGLPNVGEFHVGTDPANPDTDGDGVSDGDECRLYFSDPLAVDFDGTCTTNAVLSGDGVDGMRGVWRVDDGSLTLLERAGAVSFSDGIRLAEHGIREVRLEASFAGEFDADLVCRVDGRTAGVVTLCASETARVTAVRFLTPWLSAGGHSLEIELQNFSNDSRFSISDVAVCAPNGPDGDGNCVPDWLDSRRRASRCDRTGTVRSRVSPFCLRGRSPCPDLVSASAGTPVRRLPDFGWWTDVTLSADAATDVTVSYENGFKAEDVSVVWTPFDVLSETDVVLRRGDSLLLSAPAGAVLTLDGTPVDGADDAPLPAHFDAAGEFALACRAADGRENAITVTVVDVESVDNFPAWRGKTNSIDVNGYGFGAVSVVPDAGASVAALSVRQGAASVSLAVAADGRPNCVAFEIPNADASVAASVDLCPFSAYYTLERKYYVVGRLLDGTRVVENRLSAFDVPPGLTMRMTSGSGICFEDGAGVMEISAEDFDEIGDFSYLFYVPQGVMHPCQFLRLMVGGKAVAQ